VIGVRVLGPLEVTVDGGTADLGGPRQRCVLARLVAAHGRVVSADRLIEDLYADEAPPKALAAVQSYVSHLRRALEPARTARMQPSTLVTSPPGYALRLDSDAVDAWTFEDEVHGTAGLADAVAVHDRLSTALAAWRGSAFQEFGGLPWADLEAARLDELRLTASERLADAALQLGRAAEVVADLDRLAVEHPLREEAWRLLALALYQAGRQGDALAALRRARARLAADLGIDPGPALRELEDAILTQAPQLLAPAAATTLPAGVGSANALSVGLRPAGAVSAGGLPAGGLPAGGLPAQARPTDAEVAPLGATVFVGRDAELTQLMRSAREASAGQLRIVLVAGDAGAGKTALSGQISLRLAARGWTVTTGRCPEHEGAPVGWPWAQALRQLSRTAPPPNSSALAALLTDTTAEDGDTAAARFRLHRSVADYLRAASRSAPLLLVLEDLHRADGETLALFADITSDLAASRLLILGTYRSSEVSQQLSGCLTTLASREPDRISLGGLDADAADELIRATCTSPIDADTAGAIAERTAGNPFFIREAARLYDSEGTLAATTEVPVGVRDVLQRRISRLPATAQTILRQAAVFGTEIDVDILGDVAEAEEQVLLDAIEAGLLTGLVTEPAANRIRFAHALVRDTLYNGLSRLRRSRLHARAATAIERRSPAQVAALAHHFTQAGSEPAKAAQYCRLAAIQAERRFAYREAARLWEQSITCLDQAGCQSARDRMDLVLSLIRALAQAGDLGRGRAWRRDAIRTALPLDDPELIAQAITAFDEPRAWYSHEYYAGTDHELVGTVELTLARLPSGDHPLRCRLLTTLAFELESDGSERGYEASAEAVEIARRLRDPGALTIAIVGRWFQNFHHDDPRERLNLAVELLALPGKPVTAEALGHLLHMAASSSAADFATADQHAAEAKRITDRYDLPTIASLVGLYNAMRCALGGDLAGAAERYQQAGEQLDRYGPWLQGTSMNIMGRFTLLMMSDRVADITSELDGSPAPFPEIYALALAAGGRATDACDVAARMSPIRRDRFWLFLTALRSLLAIAVDDRGLARSAYQSLLPFAARPAGADSMVPLWPVAQILGDLARHFQLGDAFGHYQHAVAIAERAHVALWREAAMQRLAELSRSAC
jgi:DNA-binding SARP family transcriptional activator